MSLSKLCFYNDRVSHLAADKSLTDAHFIIVLINALKSLAEKMTRQNISKIIINQKVVRPIPFSTKKWSRHKSSIGSVLERTQVHVGLREETYTLVSCNSVMNGLIHFLCLYCLLFVCIYVHVILYINMRL